MELVLIEKVLISIALGALLGTERHLSQLKHEDNIAGPRTFALVALFGSLSAHLSVDYPYVVPVAGGAFIFLVIAAYWKVSPHYVGLTTEVGLICAFLLGVLCYADSRLAAVITIFVAIILAVKKSAHSLIEKISEEELFDTLKFALIALVILPVLPNTTIDPFGVVNPYKIWLLVVFISGIGYVGYILTRILGAQSGTGITGVLGGLVSSTAVTVTMSHRSEESPPLLFPALFATVIAHSIMFLRILVEVSVVNPGLLPQVVIPMAAMMVTAVVAALYFWSRKSPSKVEMEVKDPFNLVPALKFGAFFAFILVVSKVASLYLGNAGIYATSIISGLADVDAITLSMATLGGTEISQKVAVDAIILAAISNEIAKTVISVLFGSREFKKYMVATSGAVMAAGLVIILV